MGENKGLERTRQRGIVATFLPRKGYGFVTATDGEKLFVHFSDLRGHGFKTLETGEEVEYTRVMGDRGAQATDVVRLNPPSEIEPVESGSVPKRTW